MAQLTRSMIAYDLSISPHRIMIHYGEGSSLEFVFSSDLYRTKFFEKLEKNREEINLSLTKRFGVEVDYQLLADIKLYTTIEKRGFLLIKDGDEIKCRENLLLGGEKLTFKKYAE